MFVYFIRAGKKGAIKIGHARDVQRRLDQFQVGNPFKLILLAKIPCASKAHASEIEKRLHKHFWKQRIRGEWFQGNIQFKNALDKIQKDFTIRSEITRIDRKKRKAEKKLIEESELEIVAAAKERL